LRRKEARRWRRYIAVAQARLCAPERNRQCHQQAGGDGYRANDAPGGFFVTGHVRNLDGGVELYQSFAADS
jgi:hypothetical protein